MHHPQAHSDASLTPAQLKDPPRFAFRIVTIAPSDQRALDHALEGTFPASDPVAITITEVVRVKPQRADLN